MAGKNQHVVPLSNGNWGVRGEGNPDVTREASTQKQAIRIAREIARKEGSELIIHGKDGKIRDTVSYGSDPFPPRDKKH